jgi:hypothetical protein
LVVKFVFEGVLIRLFFARDTQIITVFTVLTALIASVLFLFLAFAGRTFATFALIKLGSRIYYAK